MDMARYGVALFVLLCIPSAFVLWSLIHPFSRFWRKIGFLGTYGVLSIPAGGMMAGIFALREMLLRIDFGINWMLVSFSILCVIGAGLLSWHCRKHLTLGTLLGMPELAPRQYPGTLLTEGIYAVIRHPRYVAVSIWLLGCVLFANYLMPYVFFVIGIPGMYVLVFLEEYELRARFGAQYEAYCRRVPRFVPQRLTQRHSKLSAPQENAK
jgi:protein-S-isoprenylcysteine O-methyltransferase Ste14